MKRVPPKSKKKSKAKKSAAIRKTRGKYKHLDLMKELKKSRKEDRQRERARARKPKRNVVRESAPMYGATQRDLFESDSRNGERLGYSPALLTHSQHSQIFEASLRKLIYRRSI